MTVKEASIKWNISERRIRKLIIDGRIPGAKKIGITWIIPDDMEKPIDKRYSKETEFIIDIDKDYFNIIDKKRDELNNKKPFTKNKINSINESFIVDWTYHSNAIEGNTLTLNETKVVLEGITIGGKTVKEHLETINHEQAIYFLLTIANEKNNINEWNIKNLHHLVLKEINRNEAGRYRKGNVKISGSKYIPPEGVLVPELMERLMIDYEKWDKYHPIVKATLLHGELVKIHPFIDGNGRTARLIMNLVLINNGYVPVIIKKEDKLNYYNAIEEACNNDYTNFIKMVSEYENQMLDEYLRLIK